MLRATAEVVSYHGPVNKRGPRIEYSIIEVTNVALPTGVDLECVMSDVHELGDLDKATKP